MDLLHNLIIQIKSLFNRVDIIYLAIIVSNLISAIVLYLSLQFNWWSGFNVILFLIWVFSLTIFSDVILSRIFSLPKTYLKLLGLFLNIFLLGFIANIFTSWLAFNNLSFLASLIITSLLLFFWSYGFRKIESKPQTYLGRNEGWWNFPNWLLIILLVVVLASFIIIDLFQTGNYLSSPWQVLPLEYLFLILVLLIIVFSLVFSKKKVWLILVSIIIASFLMHSYLLVYADGFGGDRWRHLGAENRILSEMVYQPTLLTNNIWYKAVLGVNIPRALIAGPKISYGFEWSLAIIVYKISHLNIFILDKYLILFLWSLFVPLVAFVLALQIRDKKNQAILASALTLIFYILQYYGSQTLPISFSALYFLFLISCFLAYLKNKQNIILAFLIFLTVLSYFGYSLAFIILIISLVWLLTISLKPLKKYFIFIILSSSIFLVEIISSFSNLKKQFSIGEIVTNVFVKGNFLFFEHGQFLPMATRYWPILSLVISLILGGILVISIFKMLKEKRAPYTFLVGLSLILFINYLLSWIFLDGLHTLTRRMNVFMVLLFIFILAYFLSNLITTKFRAYLVAIILSLIGVLTYASGPVLEAMVTHNDALSMQYVWQQIYNNPRDNCILADTWPLLALESYSAKEIVAGNFTSDFDYNQNERVELFNNFILNPSLDILNEAINITKTKSCFVVVDYNIINQEKVYQINNLLGEPKIFGQNLVWQFK